jgi:hypothetical protein
MFDLLNETVITFAQAGREVPGEVHRGTISRWARIGVRGIRLESVIIGGRTVTSVEALYRFLAACREHRWAGIANGYTYEQVLAARERLRKRRPKNRSVSDDGELAPHPAGKENGDGGRHTKGQHRR